MGIWNEQSMTKNKNKKTEKSGRKKVAITNDSWPLDIIKTCRKKVKKDSGHLKLSRRKVKQYTKRYSYIGKAFLF